mgnify:CR=1 FL=1
MKDHTKLICISLLLVLIASCNDQNEALSPKYLSVEGTHIDIIESGYFKNYLTTTHQLLSLRRIDGIKVAKTDYDHFRNKEEVIQVLKNYFMNAEEAFLLLQQNEYNLTQLQLELPWLNTLDRGKKQEIFSKAVQAITEESINYSENTDGYCEEARKRALSDCDQDAMVGLILCLPTLPTGWVYFVCWATVAADGLICIDRAESEYEKCIEARKTKK